MIEAEKKSVFQRYPQHNIYITVLSPIIDHRKHNTGIRPRSFEAKTPPRKLIARLPKGNLISNQPSALPTLHFLSLTERRVTAHARARLGRRHTGMIPARGQSPSLSVL